jgi:hypothetical protein
MRIVNFLYKSVLDVNSLIINAIIDIMTMTSSQSVGMIYNSLHILSA